MTSHRSSLFAAHRRPTGTPTHTNTARGDVETEATRENDAILDALDSDVRRLKAEAHKLRDETDEQNKLADKLMSVMQGARDGVKSTVTRLESTMQRYGWKHIVLFAIVITIVAVMLYTLGRKVLAASPAAPQS